MSNSNGPRGSHDVINASLIAREKNLLPPLHIKLVLIKQYVTALDEDNAALQYIQSLFPKLTEGKVRAGIFVGPQVRRCFNLRSWSKQ
jgi:hypothetical protein